MDAFRRFVLVALLAGSITGVVVTVAHQIGAVPIILDAEVFEQTGAASESQAATHDHVRPGTAVTEHVHDGEAWSPADGLERTVYTALADVLTGFGFALLLVAGFALAGGGVGWRRGLLWGLAGFAAFTLAPTLGLPPEVPGTETAPLLERQVWWVATVAMTAGGLALIAFRRQPAYAVLAVVLIVLPHLVGAPQPAQHHAAVPVELVHRFAVAVTVTSLLFWVCLGMLTGHLYDRFGRARERRAA